MDGMAQNLEQLDKGWHSERPESALALLNEW